MPKAGIGESKKQKGREKLTSRNSDGSLQRTTVKMIGQTLEPKQVFELVCSKEYQYPDYLKPEYPIHDRAGMAMSYLTLGRVTEIFGGYQYRRLYVDGLYPDAEQIAQTLDPPVDLTELLKKYPRRYLQVTSKLYDSIVTRHVDKRNWQEETIGRHRGISRENVTIDENFIQIVTMPIVKRSGKIIRKYGQEIAQRNALRFPLKRGLFNNPFYDQLVPFTWLVLEYLQTFAPTNGKLFHYQDSRAWTVMKQVAGVFPNWFRTQSDRFYKQCLYRGDVINYAIFAGRVKVENTMTYQRFAWNADLKDPELVMNFAWIDPAVQEIKSRIERAKHLQVSCPAEKNFSL